MKVRQAVFLFGTGLGFDHAFWFHADGFGGLKIPFSFLGCVSRRGSGALHQVRLLLALHLK